MYYLPLCLFLRDRYDGTCEDTILPLWFLGCFDKKFSFAFTISTVIISFMRLISLTEHSSSKA